jgi:hypothetical protein
VLQVVVLEFLPTLRVIALYLYAFIGTLGARATCYSASLTNTSLK